MTISFTRYPISNRVPNVGVEIDNTRANTGADNQRTLIIGQMLATGTATAGVPIRSEGIGHATTIAGRGSMLAQMVETYRANDSFGELWLLPVADEGASTKASGTVTITGTATSSGTVTVYIAGVGYRVGVQVGDTSIIVITRFLAALCNQPLPFTVTAGAKVLALSNPANPGLAVDATTVTITAGLPLTITYLHGGLVGNDVQMSLNFGGSLAGEIAPTGITVAFSGAALTGGALNPVLTTPLANLADMKFHYVIMPYSDTTSLDRVQTFLDDTTGRWAWDRKLFGHAFSATRGALGALTTFGSARNDQHMSIVGYNGSPTPVSRWATAFGAKCAESLRADPGVSVTQRQMVGITAPPISLRFTLGERNSLLYDGLSTVIYGDDGSVNVERVITTYQRTAAGVEDNSYLDVETLACLQYAIEYIIGQLSTKYARKRLVSDDARVGTNNNTVSPATIKAEIITQYRALESAGIVQNAKEFAKNVIVEAAGNGLVKIYWPADLVGQLRSIALLVAFTKST